MGRRTKRFLIVAGLTPVAAVGGYLLWVALLAWEFDKRVDRYRAEGLPLSRAALAAPGVPDAENAAVPLTEAWMLVDALGHRAQEVIELHRWEDEPLTEAQRAEVRSRLVVLIPCSRSSTTTTTTAGSSSTWPLFVWPVWPFTCGRSSKAAVRSPRASTLCLARWARVHCATQ